VRIVSLLPSTTEACFALGLGDAVVGVTHECDWPDEARTRPHLTRNVLPPGAYTSTEIDALIRQRVLDGQSIYDLDRDLLEQLAPDLILTQALCEVCAVAYDDVVSVARTLPRVPRVASFEPRTVDEILASIVEIAALAGVPERGETLVASLRARLAAIEHRLAGVPPGRVLCLEWLDPPMVGGHWVPEMVRRAGGIDVLGPAGQPSVYVDWEAISDAAPEVVILMPCGYDLDTSVARARELDSTAAWRELPAVQSGWVYAVDGSGYFNRPGPRVVDGVELLARLLHPRQCHGLGPCGAARRLPTG
jgi:iron complex transport system substrate-binding protein